MSFQVGASCFATAADAGRAACSQFPPVASISGDTVKTVSCSGSDGTSGALVLDIVSTASGVTTTSTISQPVTFGPCVQSDYVDAAEVVAGAALAVWAVWYGGKKVLQMLNWSRGSEV